MNKVIRRSLQGAAIAGGIVLAGSAAAQANLSDSIADNGVLNDIGNHSLNGPILNGNSVLSDNNVDAPIAVSALDSDAVAVDGHGHHGQGDNDRYTDKNAGGYHHEGGRHREGLADSIRDNGVLNDIGNHSLNGPIGNCNSIGSDNNFHIPVAVGVLDGEALAV